MSFHHQYHENLFAQDQKDYTDDPRLDRRKFKATVSRLQTHALFFFLKNLYINTTSRLDRERTKPVISRLFLKMDWIDCLVLAFPLLYNIKSKISIIKGPGGFKLLIMKTFCRDQID